MMRVPSPTRHSGRALAPVRLPCTRDLPVLRLAGAAGRAGIVGPAWLVGVAAVASGVRWAGGQAGCRAGQLRADLAPAGGVLCRPVVVRDSGRYLLPGLAAYAVLFALGLDLGVVRRLRAVWPSVAAMVLGGVCAVTLYGYFLPAYRPLPAQPLPHALAFRFEDAAELTGVSTSMIRARPGDVVEIILTWHALGPTDGVAFVSAQRTAPSSKRTACQHRDLSRLTGCPARRGRRYDDRRSMHPRRSPAGRRVDRSARSGCSRRRWMSRRLCYAGRIAINNPADRARTTGLERSSGWQSRPYRGRAMRFRSA
jgi:hypothetical protein